jgi:hypothetical protein
MPGPSDEDIELKSDLEAQKTNLLSRRKQDDDSDDDDGVTLNSTARSSMSTDIIKPPVLPDGAARTSQKSSQTSFLIWTAVNTLATIGIVSHNYLRTHTLISANLFSSRSSQIRRYSMIHPLKICKLLSLPFISSAPV